MSKVLTGHQAAAEKALLHELRRQGMNSQAVTVDVLAQADGLLLELDVGPAMSRTQAQRIASYVAQAVHYYDPRTATVEISVRVLLGGPASVAVSAN